MKASVLSLLLVGLIPATLLLTTSTQAQTTAYVDFLGGGYDSGTHISTVQTLTSGELSGDGYSGATPASIGSMMLYDYVTGESTGWSLSIATTDMEYRTHSFTDDKDAGAEVTAGDAFTTFGGIGFEWDGVMRAEDGNTANSQVILTFAGLSASATYDFALLHNYRSGTPTAYAEALLGNADGTLDGSTSFAVTRGNTGGDMISFSGIAAGDDGMLSVTIYSPIDGDFYLQGFSLAETSAVPEPAETAAVVGTLGLGYVFWRRRQRPRNES